MLLSVAEYLHLDVCVNSGFWIRSSWILEQQKWTQEQCVFCKESHPQTGIWKRSSWEMLASHSTLESDGCGLWACVFLCVYSFVVLGILVAAFCSLLFLALLCKRRWSSRQLVILVIHSSLQLSALFLFCDRFDNRYYSISRLKQTQVKKVYRSERLKYGLHRVLYAFSSCYMCCCENPKLLRPGT